MARTPPSTAQLATRSTSSTCSTTTSTLQFTDCTSLITDSGSTRSGVAIQQLHEQQGIPYDKLVLGKPISTAAQNNGGYMDPSALAQCVAQGKALGWSGSVMFWQWSASIVSACRVIGH
jgi:hypothetical protein